MSYFPFFNGKAKITFLGVDKPTNINHKLDNVRYIKDCSNGSSVNSYSQWSEIQAIYNGVNVAKGKNVTGTSAAASDRPYPVITNGLTHSIAPDDLGSSSVTGSLQCVTVDLVQSYDLDEVAVWHHWVDGRTYNENVTYVSSDNKNWVEIINVVAAETSNGKRVNAWE